MSARWTSFKTANTAGERRDGAFTRVKMLLTFSAEFRGEAGRMSFPEL